MELLQENTLKSEAPVRSAAGPARRVQIQLRLVERQRSDPGDVVHMRWAAMAVQTPVDSSECFGVISF